MVVCCIGDNDSNLRWNMNGSIIIPYEYGVLSIFQNRHPDFGIWDLSYKDHILSAPPFLDYQKGKAFVWYR